MKNKFTLIAALCVASIAVSASDDRQLYEPSFESLSKADPAPEWFKDAKFGIYFHWGVYSVPAYANEWYPRNMYMKNTREQAHHTEVYGDPVDWPYDNFITGATDKAGNFVQFTPKLKSEGGQFDPEEWAQLFADAGARFAGPVAEHHDGFSMWASEANPWNAKDMGPRLDLVGLLTDAIREKGMKIILSMHHAYNITGFYEAVPPTNDPKLQMLYGQQGKAANEALWLNKHEEIIDNYQPDIIWQDFNLHVISESVLTQFLAYYYNRAMEWNKPVVATYKDGLNTDCAVLDYERGGPIDIKENYWLTDDAISSSSWCYTEGIGYYSKKQVLHGFLDRISKNGNLLLNISPKADGSIPSEQKEILLAMGNWLKKYGEAVYATRAWKKYGEGPTKMGADHGVFMEPAEGTAKDVRYTRSKDNKTLYAILLGWDDGQKEVLLESLSSDRIDLQSLKSVSLINGEAEKYKTLSYEEQADGLRVNLPEKELEELAYVLKLSFDSEIPVLDRYVEVNPAPFYHLMPGSHMNNPVAGMDLTLTTDRKDPGNQWKLEPEGKGLYRIRNRGDLDRVFTCMVSENTAAQLKVAPFTGAANQLWKIQDSFDALFSISNHQYPDVFVTVEGGISKGNGLKAVPAEEIPLGWRLMEVCDLEQKAFAAHRIPGTIEAENFDIGCSGDAYYDLDEINAGGAYRKDLPVDIAPCSQGTYLIGWTKAGEWLAYTIAVDKTATYEVAFHVATINATAKLHLECDGINITGEVSVPNTGDFQNWTVVKRKVYLDEGSHMFKLFMDEGGFNLDKIVFEETD